MLEREMYKIGFSTVGDIKYLYEISLASKTVLAYVMTLPEQGCESVRNLIA